MEEDHDYAGWVDYEFSHGRRENLTYNDFLVAEYGPWLPLSRARTFQERDSPTEDSIEKGLLIRGWTPYYLFNFLYYYRVASGLLIAR